MQDKGYEHPLFSLDRIPADSCIEEPRFFLWTPNGRLVVPSALRQRAAKLRLTMIENAMSDALAYHERFLDKFEPRGFTMEWNGNVRYWCQQASEQVAICHRADVSAPHTRGTRLLALGAIRRYWRLLHVTTGLAGLGAGLIPSRPPRRIVDIIDQLGRSLLRAQEPMVRAALGRYGFGEREFDGLTKSHALLVTSHEAVLGYARTVQQSRDQEVVIRAAVLGDICRFSRVAKVVLYEVDAERVRMSRLLRRPRRPSEVEAPRP